MIEEGYRMEYTPEEKARIDASRERTKELLEKTTNPLAAADFGMLLTKLVGDVIGVGLLVPDDMSHIFEAVTLAVKGAGEMIEKRSPGKFKIDPSTAN